MKLLLNASKEHADFHELIGTDVTFACDIISVSGNISHEKGEKAFISDVQYTAGYWSNLCSDIYVKPRISTFQINGVSGSWIPNTFEEFRNHKH